ncbi:hypothetical protein L1987_07787 [Smallanthus sonchifolius]|uniref:Uncharacterized protein n=1 Tax=Smallanthus sonchifolius TaxID=185202 RepID=A0ACB9JJY4_9ASTR|nr:hypothetical protein L1987_07787 [Smallanthus sonchifolius]
MYAVRTAAVKAVTVFCLIELLTTRRLEGAGRVFEDETLKVRGLKKEFVVVFWVNGIAMERAEYEPGVI